MLNRDKNVIPDGTIACLVEHPEHEASVFDIVEPLRGKAHREELGKHSFHCLPVVIGNQYGFVIKSMLSWRAKWNGGEERSDTKIIIDGAHSDSDVQSVSSHFGNGIVTVQNRFSFRTPPGVNLMVLDPPNYFRDNLSNLFAVVETDNLRRDFTFNLKIVKPNQTVRVNKGEIISAIIPIPRYFVDQFDLALGSQLFDPYTLEEEAEQSAKFAALRNEVDISKPHQVGKLYWRGLDADETPFPDHQRQLRPPLSEAPTPPETASLWKKLLGFARK